MISDEQLAELERLDREATPGPWAWDGWRLDLGNDTAIALRASAHVDPGVANADLIAAARNALPVLVAEVRRLREELSGCREAFGLLRQRIESSRRSAALGMRERAAQAAADAERQTDAVRRIEALPLPGDE